MMMILIFSKKNKQNKKLLNPKKIKKFSLVNTLKNFNLIKMNLLTKQKLANNFQN